MPTPRKKRSDAGKPKGITEAKRIMIVIDLLNGVSLANAAKNHDVSEGSVLRISKAIPAGDRKKRATAVELKSRVAERTAALEMELKDQDLDSEEATTRAVERAAITRADVILRMKAEWDEHGKLSNGVLRDANEVADYVRGIADDPSLYDKDQFDLKRSIGVGLKDRATVSKLVADTIARRQENERKLYGIDSEAAAGASDRPHASMSPDKLEAMVKERYRRLRSEGLLPANFFGMSDDDGSE